MKGFREGGIYGKTELSREGVRERGREREERREGGRERERKRDERR